MTIDRSYLHDLGFTSTEVRELNTRVEGPALDPWSSCQDPAEAQRRVNANLTREGRSYGARAMRSAAFRYPTR